MEFVEARTAQTIVYLFSPEFLRYWEASISAMFVEIVKLFDEEDLGFDFLRWLLRVEEVCRWESQSE